ncbi:MAG: hypothetical protein OMM_11819 [Candidatus Magnetoglobus multicellularis str. Araruama]|uniref:Uncharacterized protein n=1 Tax=Candidatus Magnetoglobus multicellularis str. Araruama TaxID=890399 RepID=A0A1V1NXE8_9BACT|nr:MAG: hypothetical protein OMM_11819 [Candidatus Magnetoglobus multicellularis str. Araruama]
MNINKVEIKEGGNATFADNIYNYGITSNELNELIRNIKQMDQNIQAEISQQCKEIDNSTGKNKKSKIKKFNEFIIKQGLAISNSLAASAIIEIGKSL